MSMFLCPICKAPLIGGQNRLFCKHGHSFDKASEGYVHLLPANKMNSRIPGDSKEMSASRSYFLNKGYYRPLLDELCRIVLRLSNEDIVSVLDCGCGEGYYTTGIYDALKSSGTALKMAGIDISRPSVRRAAKRNREIEFAVASVFELPVSCSSFDILLNIFSPLCAKEYCRVLKPGGYYIYVVPAARHLWQLKQALYDIPYENREADIPYEGFLHIETVPVRYTAFIETAKDIFALFQMTPYYWKTSAKGAEKLKKLTSLSTEVAFDIHIYQKTK